MCLLDIGGIYNVVSRTLFNIWNKKGLIIKNKPWHSKVLAANYPDRISIYKNF